MQILTDLLHHSSDSYEVFFQSTFVCQNVTKEKGKVYASYPPIQAGSAAQWGCSAPASSEVMLCWPAQLDATQTGGKKGSSLAKICSVSHLHSSAENWSQCFRNWFWTSGGELLETSGKQWLKSFKLEISQKYVTVSGCHLEATPFILIKEWETKSGIKGDLNKPKEKKK